MLLKMNVSNPDPEDLNPAPQASPPTYTTRKRIKPKVKHVRRNLNKPE
jgi:hypothetical protein